MNHLRACKYSGLKMTHTYADDPECCCPPAPPSLLDLQLAEPERGSVVRFKVGFQGSPKAYTYSAIEAGSLWYITGRDGAVGREWSQLLRLLFRTDAIILSAELATSWENL